MPTPTEANTRPTRRAPQTWAQKADEAGERDEILARMDRHFYVEREVHGNHITGPRMRIDAVIRPRKPEGWKNPDARLGLEFKWSGSTVTRDATAAVAQAINYAHTEWEGHGRIYVFLCPGLMPGLSDRYQDRRVHDAVRYWLVRLAAQFGVGELKQDPRYGRGLCLYHSGTHCLWCERDGVVEASRHALIPKFGAR